MHGCRIMTRRVLMLFVVFHLLYTAVFLILTWIVPCRNSFLSRRTVGNKLPSGKEREMRYASSHLDENDRIDVNDRVEYKALLKKYFKLRETKVNPINVSRIIDNQRFCSDADNKPLLLMLVPSMPGNFQVRLDIRRTIGSFASNTATHTVDGEQFSTIGHLEKTAKFKLLFVNGLSSDKAVNKALLEESEKYRDIIQGNFIDTYQNLTRKMLMALQWVTDHCRGAKFIMKTDEDVYTNVPVLLDMLQSERFNGSRNVMYGHVYRNGVVHRDGRWSVSERDYPLPYYPDYISGTSYLLSGPLIPRLTKTAEYMPYLPIEDVFITGCLSIMTGAKLESVDMFSYWAEGEPDPCWFFQSSRVTTTNVDTQMRWKFWAVQNNFTHYCGEGRPRLRPRNRQNTTETLPKHWKNGPRRQFNRHRQ